MLELCHKREHTLFIDKEVDVMSTEIFQLPTVLFLGRHHDKKSRLSPPIILLCEVKIVSKFFFTS
jgi:hypothetical protein